MELSWNKTQIYNMKLPKRTFTVHEQSLCQIYGLKLHVKLLETDDEIVCFISLSRFLYKDIKWNKIVRSKYAYKLYSSILP